MNNVLITYQKMFEDTLARSIASCSTHSSFAMKMK
jgi:hypothetical protein